MLRTTTTSTATTSSEQSTPNFPRNYREEESYGTAAALLKVLPSSYEDDLFTMSRGATAPSSSNSASEAFSRLVESVHASRTESVLHSSICDLLNFISQSVWKDFEATEPIIYRPFRGTTPDSWGSKKHRSKPDFGCYRGTIEDFDKPSSTSTNTTPWPFLDGIGEAKLSWTGDDVPQILNYSSTNLEQRPDMHSALGIHATSMGYVFVRVDSAGSYRSDAYPWNDISPLVLYLRELYLSPHDPSLTRGANHWTVELNGTRYNAFPIHSSPPPGRRSWIATAVDPQNPEQLIIIKDMWEDESRSNLEGDLLQEIHKLEAVPGAVECLTHGYVKGCPTQTFNSGAKTMERRKYRVVLRQVGFPLSSCESTLEFLMVCIDAVQVHRKCLEKGVLHRDFGWNNILRRPKNGKYGIEWDSSAQAGMLFVGGVTQQENCPSSLVIDFDNSATWYPPDEVQEAIRREVQEKNLAQRTGTPMFIAVDSSVSAMTWGEYQAYTSSHLSKGLYVANEDAYHYAEAYDLAREGCRFQQHRAQVETWTVPYKDDTPVKILHEPYHDMESLFWTIAWHCVRSRPAPPYYNRADPDVGDDDGKGDPDSTDSMSAFAHFCDKMLSHEVGQASDQRVSFRGLAAVKWEAALHPFLRGKGLGPMLSAMGRYLSFPWQHFLDKTYPQHAHDMMVLMLLNAVAPLIRRKETIPLKVLPRQLPDKISDKLGLRSSDIGRSSLASLSSNAARLTTHDEAKHTSTTKKITPSRRARTRGEKRLVTDEIMKVAEEWHQLRRIEIFWFI